MPASLRRRFPPTVDVDVDAANDRARNEPKVIGLAEAPVGA